MDINNKLVLRVLNSPWANDIKTPVDLSKTDKFYPIYQSFDNNFIYLKGEAIHTATTKDSKLVINKTNGEYIEVDLSSVNTLQNVLDNGSVASLTGSNENIEITVSEPFSSKKSYFQQNKDTILLEHTSGGTNSSVVELNGSELLLLHERSVGGPNPYETHSSIKLDSNNKIVFDIYDDNIDSNWGNTKFTLGRHTSTLESPNFNLFAFGTKRHYEQSGIINIVGDEQLYIGWGYHTTQGEAKAIRFGVKNDLDLENSKGVVVYDEEDEFGFKYYRDYSHSGTTDPLWIPSWGAVTELTSNFAIVGTYTDNYVPRWNATTNTLESGTIQDNGSNVHVGGSPDSTAKLKVSKGSGIDEGIYVDVSNGGGNGARIEMKNNSGTTAQTGLFVRNFSNSSASGNIKGITILTETDNTSKTINSVFGIQIQNMDLNSNTTVNNLYQLLLGDTGSAVKGTGEFYGIKQNATNVKNYFAGSMVFANGAGTAGHVWVSKDDAGTGGWKSITEITDLQSELDDKLDTTTFESYTGSVKDVHVSSGTVNAQDQSVTFTNTTGGTFNLENAAVLFTDKDSYVTGGTYNANTGIVTYKTSSGFTFEVTGFTTGMTDTYVTSGTLDGTTLKLTKSDGGAVSDIELSGLKVWDKNNTNAYYNTGNVGIGTNNPTEKLEVAGNIFINDTSSSLKINDYTFPTSKGTNGQVLKTDGNGNVSWSNDNDTSIWSENAGTATYDGHIVVDSLSTFWDNPNAGGRDNTRILNPKGGSYSNEAASSTGSIIITLPQGRNGSMLSMTVKIYDYAFNEHKIVNVSGYLYSLASHGWNNGSVWIDNNPKYSHNLTVWLGYDAELDKCVVIIGEKTSTWGYLDVNIIDVQIGHVNQQPNKWNEGWKVELSTDWDTIMYDDNGESKKKYHTNDLTNSNNASKFINTQANNWYRNSNNTVEYGDAAVAKSFITEGYGNRRILSPEGATLYDDTASGVDVVGSFIIKLPPDDTWSTNSNTNLPWTNTHISLTAKIYDYSLDEHLTLNIAGYTYKGNSPSGPDDGGWTRTSAWIEGNPNDEHNFNVRFGYDSRDKKCVIIIGDTDSKWYKPKLYITDLQVAGSNSTQDWHKGWSVELSADWLQQTIISDGGLGPQSTPRYVVNYTHQNTQAHNWIRNTDNSIQYGSGDVQILGTNNSLTINDYTFPTSKGTDGQVLKTDGSGTLTWQDDTNTSIWTELNSNIYYNTGNVGIGTTVPLEKLHVSTGDNEDSGNISFLIGGTAGTNARTGRIIKNTSSPYEMTIRASDFSSGNNLILNDTGGNVGIGTDSPDGPLHVETPTGIATIRVKSSGDTSSAFHAINKDGGAITLGVQGSKLKLNSSGSLTNNHLVIDSNGNVGIGTDSPTQKLEVAGGILADSLSTTWSTGRAGNTRILSPGGGSYSEDGGVDGAFIITLPQGGSNTMISMSVKIFDFTTNEHITLNIAGYAVPITHSTYTSAWTRQSAWIEGSPKDEHNFKVRFTYDHVKDKNVIIIGETDSHWDYPDINIIDVQVGYDDSTPDKWNNGWEIELSEDWDTITYVDEVTNESKRRYVEPNSEHGIIENTQVHNWIRNNDNSIIYNQGTVNIGLRSISENNIKLFATSDNSNNTIDNNAIPTTGIGDSTHTALGYGTSTSNSYGIAMGTLASSGKSWIQGKRFKGEGPQVYSLLLNPLGGNVGIGTETPNQKLEVAGGIKVSDTSNSLTINDYTLPAADGGVGQVLKTDGSGNVSWQNDTDTNTSIWTENAGTNTATYDGHIVVDSLSTIWQNPNTTSRDNTRILNPKGGSFSNEINTGDARNSKGSIIITLPQGKSSTMISMTVKIFDYAFNEHLILNVSGYLFGGASHGWNNGSVWIDNNPKYSHNLTVWLGYDAELGKNVVIIGEPDTTWGTFLDVNVMDVQAQHHNEEFGNWNDGWNIELSDDWDTLSNFITTEDTAGSDASKFIHTQVNNWIRNTDNSIKYESGDVQILGTNNSLTINDYTFPTSKGTNGQVLKTDGSGNVSWQNDTDTNTSIWTENTSYTRDADDTNISGAYYNTGFVGIGNDKPQSKLHLEGSNFTDSAIRFLNKATTTNNQDYWMIGSRAFSSGADGFEIGRKGDSTGGKLYITNDGDVSIGNGYEPTNKLEVNGNIFIDETSSSLKINDYTLPAADGTDGQVLKTDGNGNTTWGYYGLKVVSVNVKDVVGNYNLSENTFTKVLTYENDNLAGYTYDFILPVISTESKGNEVVVKHVGGKQTIAIVAPGVTKIDNHYSSVNITNGDSITFYCDGLDWYIKSHYKNVFGSLPGYTAIFTDENNNTSPTEFDPNIYFGIDSPSNIGTSVHIAANNREVYVHTSTNKDGTGKDWYITETTGDAGAGSTSGYDGEAILIYSGDEGGTISFATSSGRASTLTVTSSR